MNKWTLTWTKLIPLDRESMQSIPDDVAGVYRLSYKKADNGGFYVFYVGRAEDIKQRLNQHLSNEENVCIKNYLDRKECSFRYAEITKEDIRKAAERQLYNYYEPFCNEQRPEGEMNISINFS